MKQMLMLLGVMLLAFASPAMATDDLSISYAPIVKKAAPAVVNIYAKSHVQVQDNLSPFLNDPLFKQFFSQQGMDFGDRTRQKVVSSLGSGVIIKADGMIVTSNHVIKDAQEISVVLSDKREYAAKVVAKDPQSDLAFLMIVVKEPLPFLDMRDSDTLEVGDRVLAIGNPFGVGQTVTSGIISALARPANGVSDYQFFIQTDAAINPGNSGGALVDMTGKLIGINTAIYSSSGGSNGIGFAIPANMVRAALDGKVESGKLVRPWVGVAVQPVTVEMAESMGLPGPQGVIVKTVIPDSPAEKAGIKVGDVILSIGSNDISSEQEFMYRLALAHIGDNVEFKILRQGQPQTLAVTMQAPIAGNPDQRVLKGRHPLDGVTVANITPALAAQLGQADVTEGVVVVDSATSRFGIDISLQPGDIIREINGTKITSTAQLEKIMNSGSQQWKMAVQRGNNAMSFTIRMQ